MRTGESGRPKLAATDLLVLPMHKRVVTQYAINATGNRELRLFHGDKEISFDEPELFRFGETLGKQSRFIAGIATTWGEGLSWAQVRDLLDMLIAEGVLRHADEYGVDEVVMGEEGAQPSPLPPAPCTVARSWNESEMITGDLAGRALEAGYLELVVPIFRVAHMALDQEGRQVGEANVFPPAMRLDIPTRWRTCIYEGTRHQADKPMNVTALKSMRAHWGQMMGALLAVRAAYLGRFPEAKRGWTVGHLERLSVTVLALPTWLLMRRESRIENGQLHPALSSLFRVTDGLRMTMHQMLFVPFGEPALSPDTPMSAAEVYAYAERNFSFHAGHGVCAGPQVMIEEFLAVLMDGKEPRGGVPQQFDTQVEDALSGLDTALDYALLGLQAYAAVFSVWPLMTRAYAELEVIAMAWAPRGPANVASFADLLHERNVRIVKTGYLATEERRTDREQVYADMHAQCGTAVNGAAPRPALAERIALSKFATGGSQARVLRGLLARRFDLAASAVSPHLDHLTTCILAFLRQKQAILRAACEVQREINALLGRTPPERPFTATDLGIYHRLLGDPDGRPPYLLEDLEKYFGMRITLDKDVLEIDSVPA